tara:strand:- start:627 stop:1184 length:558 start_codon:yes stop_codon:yes gene_type:complete
MARDYKYRASPKKQKQSIPPWIWILTGCFLGILIMSIAWFQLEPSSNAIEEWIGAKPDREPQSIEKKQVKIGSLVHKPRFKFYEKLGRQEIKVPDEKIELREQSEKNKNFQIQIGSFKKYEDSEALKAKLAFLGIETKIVKIELSRDYTRFRVLSKSIEGREDLDLAIKKLNKNGYNDLFIKPLQ